MPTVVCLDIQGRVSGVSVFLDMGSVLGLSREGWSDVLRDHALQIVCNGAAPTAVEECLDFPTLHIHRQFGIECKASIALNPFTGLTLT